MICKQCGSALTDVLADDDMFCDDCWECYNLSIYRCFSFATIYDAESGVRLSYGGSVNNACAERRALWKLDAAFTSVPKIVVVARIRKNRKDTKMSFGNSKPCAQCIIAMQMYNIVRVYYSTNKDCFTVCNNISTLSNDYYTKSKSIILFDP